MKYGIDNAAVAGIVELVEDREREAADKNPTVILKNNGVDHRGALNGQKRRLDTPEKLHSEAKTLILVP